MYMHYARQRYKGQKVYNYSWELTFQWTKQTEQSLQYSEVKNKGNRGKVLLEQ